MFFWCIEKLHRVVFAEQAIVKLLMARGRYHQAQATLQAHCELYAKTG